MLKTFIYHWIIFNEYWPGPLSSRNGLKYLELIRKIWKECFLQISCISDWCSILDPWKARNVGASWVNIDIRLKRASVQIRRLTRRLVVRIFLVLSCNITLSQWENIQRHPHHYHREDVWFHQSAHEMFPSLPEYHIAILVNIPMLMMILYADDWWRFTCIQRRSLEWMLVEQMQFDRKLILCHSPLAGDWWLRRRGWRWWCLWWFKVEADVWLASSEAALKRCREIGDEGQ